MIVVWWIWRAITDIRYLVEKYPDGLDGYVGEMPAGA